MAVELSEELQYLLLFVVGERWPEADEDQLRAAAGIWRALAGHFEEARTEGDRAAHAVLAVNQGESITAFGRFWDRFGQTSPDGGHGYLADCAAACGSFATALDQFAGDVEGTKDYIRIQLGILAVEVALGLAGTVFTFGVSDAIAAGAVAVTRGLIQQALRRLVRGGVRQAGKLALRGALDGALDDALLQSLKAMNGGSQLDPRQLLAATAQGAAGGVIGGGLLRGRQQLATQLPGLDTGAARLLGQGAADVVTNTAVAGLSGEDLTFQNVLGGTGRGLVTGQSVLGDLGAGLSHGPDRAYPDSGTGIFAALGDSGQPRTAAGEGGSGAQPTESGGTGSASAERAGATAAEPASAEHAISPADQAGAASVTDRSAVPGDHSDHSAAGQGPGPESRSAGSTELAAATETARPDSGAQAGYAGTPPAVDAARAVGPYPGSPEAGPYPTRTTAGGPEAGPPPTAGPPRGPDPTTLAAAGHRPEPGLIGPRHPAPDPHQAGAARPAHSPLDPAAQLPPRSAAHQPPPRTRPRPEADPARRTPASPAPEQRGTRPHRQPERPAAPETGRPVGPSRHASQPGPAARTTRDPSLSASNTPRPAARPTHPHPSTPDPARRPGPHPPHAATAPPADRTRVPAHDRTAGAHVPPPPLTPDAGQPPRQGPPAEPPRDGSPPPASPFGGDGGDGNSGDGRRPAPGRLLASVADRLRRLLSPAPAQPRPEPAPRTPPVGEAVYRDHSDLRDQHEWGYLVNRREVHEHVAAETIPEGHQRALWQNTEFWTAINADPGPLMRDTDPHGLVSPVHGVYGPPAADTSRPYDTVGGLRRPLRSHQEDLEAAVPRNPDGSFQRNPAPDPAWLDRMNDGRWEADPTRAQNCVDCTISLYETYVHARPRVSAPRTFDGFTGGNAWQPVNGEAGGPARTERVTGGRYQTICDDVSQLDPAQAHQRVREAYRAVEHQLTRGGPGSYTFLVTSWPDGSSHAWSALNHQGQVYWVDPQSGRCQTTPVYPPPSSTGPLDRRPGATVPVHVEALTLDGQARPRPYQGHPLGRWSDRGQPLPPEYRAAVPAPRAESGTALSDAFQSASSGRVHRMGARPGSAYDPAPRVQPPSASGPDPTAEEPS